MLDKNTTFKITAKCLLSILFTILLRIHDVQWRLRRYYIHVISQNHVLHDYNIFLIFVSYLILGSVWSLLLISRQIEIKLIK